MAITKFTTDVENIQGLSDKPNEVEGLTADQLKKKFDDAAIDIKTYLNDTLTDEIDTAFDSLNDGWLTTSGAYASASTITVASGAVSKYSKGDKIKLTQTTVKYFYVIGVADTVLTITGGSDYILTNATITDMYYSKAVSPVGFPNKFSFTPTYTGFSVAPNLSCTFTITGTTVHFNFIVYGNGTSNSSAFTMTLPANSITYVIKNVLVVNAGTTLPTGYMQIDPSNNIVNFYVDYNKTGFTASGNKSATGQFFYLI